MTATTPNPVVDTPKRGGIAAVIALAAHAVVVLAAFAAARIVTPSAGGFEDLAAAAVTVLGGEIVVALTCVIVSAVQYRRGQRYTGVGLMGGWLVGFLVVMVLIFR